MYKLDFSYISKHRQEFMGFAIVWVVLFHFRAFEGVPVIGNFISSGELGVDVFLLLSGFGLSYSMNKNLSLHQFYLKRMIRILPVWWFLLIVMQIKNYCIGEYYPQTFTQYLCWYSGVGWWISPAISESSHNYWYEWYVPTLLVLYAIFPLLYNRNSKSLFKIMILFLIIGFFLLGFPILCKFIGVNQENLLCNISKQLSWSYQRFPVFMLGILIFKYSNDRFEYKAEKMVFFGGGYFFLLVLSLIIMVVTYILPFQYIDIVRRYCFLFIVPAFLKVISYFLKNGKLCRLLSFFGTISLELYLIHVVRWPLLLMDTYITNSTMSLIATFAVCTLIAFLVHELFIPISKIIKIII